MLHLVLVGFEVGEKLLDSFVVGVSVGFLDDMESDVFGDEVAEEWDLKVALMDLSILS